MLGKVKRHLYRYLRYASPVEAAQAMLRHASTIRIGSNIRVSAGRGDIVIDCGANVGDITSRLARTGAKVFAFEPHPLCYKILRRRFSLLPHVNCINRGVMDHACSAQIATPSPTTQFDSLASTVSASLINRTGHRKTDQVECIDFADFVFAQKSRIRFIKMDIEGCEVAVLNHLIDTGAIDLIDQVVVETHERFSPELDEQTAKLRERLMHLKLDRKVSLDWY